MNTPAQEIDGLQWEPMWISEMGCLRPCAQHVGRNISGPWLYGGSGYAFLLNIHERLCPSGVGPCFDEAIGHYEAVARNLERVTQAFPTSDHKPEYVEDGKRIAEAGEALQAAKAAEAQGVAVLEQLTAALACENR